MIEVRKATVGDIEQLLPLFEAYRVFYKKEPAPVQAKQFLEERIRLDESMVYLAFEGDQALGFTQLYPLFSSTRMKRLWLLNDLYVAETHRGRGISKLLIDAAKDLARVTKAAGVSLETEKSNLIGNQLYPATEFELDDSHNFYFWSV